MHYKRVDETILRTTRQQFEQNIVYRCCRGVLADIAYEHDDLHPDEVWKVVFDIIHGLQNSTAPDFVAETLWTELCILFSKFEENNVVTKRNKESAERSAFLVFAVLFALLTANGERQENPYKEIGDCLASHICKHPLWQKFWKYYDKKEDEEEAKGRNIGIKDYLQLNIQKSEFQKEDIQAKDKVCTSTAFEYENTELFKYIHYEIVDEQERLSIHKQICNIVRLPKMTQICNALNELRKNRKILSTIEQSAMLAELRRLGMPGANRQGFSDQNFYSAYTR